jgi:microtubule-associated protein-like 6
VCQLTPSGKKTLLSEAHYGVRHHIGELWGAAACPTRPQAATCGDDGTVRVWDLNTHRLVAQTKLASLARAIAYSPTGDRLAVGLGGRLGGKEAGPEGQFHVLDARTLEVVFTATDAVEWIQDIKWSPDGTKVAVSSHDNKIRVYNASAGFALKATCGAHNSFITHIDFSADSKYLQSNCGAYELLFHDADTGAHLPGGASKLKDAEWASWTCVLGWPVQGIWPAAADGTDINAVDRSPSKSLLATADDFGKVKLFNYPVAEVGAAFVSFDGHSSHVTNARFTPNEQNLITTGGNDRCVFQWKLRR